jgi:hypothetical protein
MAHGSHKQRALLGVAVTGQTVGVILAALTVAVLIGLAILNWLESTA